MIGARHSQHGFTLMELIVAAGIFIVIISLTFGAIVSMTKLERKMRVEHRLYADMSYALEKMAREITYGTINFEKMAGLPNPLSSLYLTTSSGEEVVFTTIPINKQPSQYGCQDTAPLGCVFMGKDRQAPLDYNDTIDSEEYYYLTSSGVHIEQESGLSFYLSPNPFTWGQTAQDKQGQVTIVLTATSSQDGAVSLTLQTTVVSRYYRQDLFEASTNGDGSSLPAR